MEAGRLQGVKTRSHNLNIQKQAMKSEKIHSKHEKRVNPVIKRKKPGLHQQDKRLNRRYRQRETDFFSATKKANDHDIIK